jgi:hypothetical protein
MYINTKQWRGRGRELLQGSTVTKQNLLDRLYMPLEIRIWYLSNASSLLGILAILHDSKVRLDYTAQNTARITINFLYKIPASRLNVRGHHSLMRLMSFPFSFNADEDSGNLDI